MPNFPPEFASPQIPVAGDFAHTTCRPQFGARVPVRGPAKKPNGFSGEKGSNSLVSNG